MFVDDVDSTTARIGIKIEHPDAQFCESKTFAMMLLLEPIGACDIEHLAGAPLVDEYFVQSLNASSRTPESRSSWFERHTNGFVESFEEMTHEEYPRPFRLEVTRPGWLEHLEEGMSWESIIWDRGDAWEWQRAPREPGDWTWVWGNGPDEGVRAVDDEQFSVHVDRGGEGSTESVHAPDNRWARAWKRMKRDEEGEGSSGDERNGFYAINRRGKFQENDLEKGMLFPVHSNAHYVPADPIEQPTRPQEVEELFGSPVVVEFAPDTLAGHPGFASRLQQGYPVVTRLENGEKRFRLRYAGILGRCLEDEAPGTMRLYVGDDTVEEARVLNTRHHITDEPLRVVERIGRARYRRPEPDPSGFAPTCS
jgi:hypothetical protein